MSNAKVHPTKGAGGTKRGKGIPWEGRKTRKASARKLRRAIPIQDGE